MFVVNLLNPKQSNWRPAVQWNFPILSNWSRVEPWIPPPRVPPRILNVEIRSEDEILVCNIYEQLFVKKLKSSRPFCHNFRLFNTVAMHLIVNKIADEWIRTVDLWLSEATALPTEPQPLPLYEQPMMQCDQIWRYVKSLWHYIEG